MLRILILAATLGLGTTWGMAEGATEGESSQEGSEEQQDALLTDEELQTLVAPVALFPDTLLIQILVASTEPLEVVKANRFLLDNADREPEDLEEDLEALQLDESVTVLATAFPEVIGQMTTHIDWTETMGTAMLAQSDDVMDAVQVMRDQAIDTGALVSADEQTVDVAEDETVVITPTDPNVVYVPEYDTDVVYGGPSTGDVVGGVLIAYLGFTIIDEIFDDDDDWYGYWGCRNCGGWGGGPIIANPDIDIDIDGDVNIGNRPDIGWKPDEGRRDEARDKLENRPRADGRAQKLPVERKPNRQDELRGKLSKETGARDISRDGAAARDGNLGQAARDRAGSGAGGGSHKAAIDRTHKAPGAAAPQIKKRAATKQGLPKAKPGQAASRKTGGAFEKRAAGGRAKGASGRGQKARGKRR